MANKELIELMHELVTQEKTDEEIYISLLQKGYLVKDIQESFQYVTTSSSKVDTQKKTIQIVATIGALLIGAGIFSLIASNWQTIPKVIKVFIIILSMVLAYVGGWLLKEKYRLEKSGEALMFLGSIIYGGGIFLVGQIFNIQANWPDGFILWMIGVLPTGFLLQSKPILFLAILVGFISIVGHPFVIVSFIGHNAILLTSSFLLLFSSLITFVYGYRIRKKVLEELEV